MSVSRNADFTARISVDESIEKVTLKNVVKHSGGIIIFALRQTEFASY